MLDIVSLRAHDVHRDYSHSSAMIPEMIQRRSRSETPEEFVVESIIDDTIDTEIPKTQWQFIVRWKGYDESEDTWNSWDSLKHVEALHSYLRTAGFSKYIPLSHQQTSDNEKPRKKTTKSGIVDTKLGIKVSKNLSKLQK